MEEIMKKIVEKLIIAVIFVSCSVVENDLPQKYVKNNLNEMAICFGFLGEQQAKATIRREGNIIYAKCAISKDLFNKIGLLSKFDIDEKHILSYIFFIDGLIDKNNVISETRIKGIGVYIYSNNYLTFRLFVSDNSKGFYEIEELRCFVTGIIFDDLKFIAQRIISELTGKTKTILSVANSSYLPTIVTPVNFSQDYLLVKAHLYSKRSNKAKKQYGDYSLDIDRNKHPKSCGADCEYWEENTHCKTDVNPVAPAYCETNGPCNLSVMRSRMLDTNLVSSDTVNEAYGEELLHQFRDSILTYTFWGLKMVKYYYVLQNYFDFSDISLDLLVETTYTLFQVRAILNKVINYKNHRSEIVIDSGMKAQLLSLLNNYKALTNDQLIQQIIDDIIGDVNHFYNMTIDEFIDETVSETLYE